MLKNQYCKKISTDIPTPLPIQISCILSQGPVSAPDSLLPFQVPRSNQIPTSNAPN